MVTRKIKDKEQKIMEDFDGKMQERAKDQQKHDQREFRKRIEHFKPWRETKSVYTGHPLRNPNNNRTLIEYAPIVFDASEQQSEIGAGQSEIQELKDMYDPNKTADLGFNDQTAGVSSGKKSSGR